MANFSTLCFRPTTLLHNDFIDTKNIVIISQIFFYVKRKKKKSMEIRFLKQRPKSFNAAIEILHSYFGYECDEKCVPAAQSFVQNLYFASKIENPLKTTLLSVWHSVILAK